MRLPEDRQRFQAFLSNCALGGSIRAVHVDRADWVMRAVFVLLLLALIALADSVTH
jgi:hypothetical protein